MPGRNGTGPMGLGAMTGRGAGYCSGSGMPGYGAGRRFSGGMGSRRRFHAVDQNVFMMRGDQQGYYGTPNSALEKQALENQIEVLQNELDSIRKRLSEMEGRPAS